MELGDYLKAFIDGKKGSVTDKSLEIFGQTRDKLFEYFGKDKPIHEITPDDAQSFRQWLSRKYAAATTAGHIKKSRQFFKAAVKVGPPGIITI